jgi:uncharacterized protein DUF3574
MWHSNHVRRLASVALLFGLACASYAPRQCDTLYFGTAKPDGSAVTASEWTAFVADTITPRFPGFTEWEADGHWKSEHERTHVVVIIHASSEEAAIAQIIEVYKKRFRQEAVLRVMNPCTFVAE